MDSLASHSSPLKVGIVIAPMNADVDHDSIKDLIIRLNVIQESLEFEFIDSGSSLSEYSIGVRLNRADVAKTLPVELKKLRAQLTLPGEFPIIVLSDAAFDDGFYKTGAGDWALIAIGHWLKQGQAPFAGLLFASRVINSSVIFAYVPELRLHDTTKGCLFDKNWILDDAAWSVNSGFLCSDCRNAIEISLGEPFVSDVKTLLATIADDAKLLTKKEVRKSLSWSDIVGSAWQWWRRSSMKRFMSFLIVIGVGAFSIDYWDVIMAFILSADADGDHSPTPVVVTFGSFLVFAGLFGRVWIYLDERSSSWKKARNQLIANLRILINTYEESTNSSRPWRHTLVFQESIKLASTLFENAPGSIQRCPNLSALTRATLERKANRLAISIDLKQLIELERLLIESTRLFRISG